MKAIYGDNTLLNIADIAAREQWRRIMLVTGKSSFDTSGAAQILPSLTGAEVFRWSDFAQNTDSADVWRAIEAMRGFKPDVIIAIGGGSAMDTAKLLTVYGGLESKDQLLDAIRLGAKVENKNLPLVLAPTTAGSGSEATHFAVVYIGQEKFSVAGAGLYADHVILDPALTISGSAHQKAVSGIDAVCQAIESLWAAGGTDQSRRYARHGLSILLRHIENFVKNGGDISARGMMIGSYLAGRAINVSKTTAAHALSYAITKGYGISHGHAVALTLGSFIEAHAETTHIGHIIKAFDAKDAADAANKFRSLLNNIGLSPRLSETVKTAEARQKIIASVNLERLGNNPVQFTPQEMLALLEKAA